MGCYMGKHGVWHTGKHGVSERKTPVSPLNEAIFVTAEAAHLDDVARDIVAQNLLRLPQIHTPRQQLDQVARLEDHVGVPRFSCRRNRHRALDQIELAADAVSLEDGGDLGPGLTQILLSIRREEHRERRLLE